MTVLDQWLSTRDGGRIRAGLAPDIKAVLPENSVVTNLTADELARALGAMATTKAGQVVTPETALRQSTVYGCVSLLTGAIASLSMPIYERAQGRIGARREVDHDYWWFLNESANDEDTSAMSMEFLFASKFFYGDGFGRLLRASRYSNRVIGWRAYHPLRVEPFYEAGTWQKLYRFYNRDGTTEVLLPDDVIHIPSLGFDGLRSPSPITYAAREAIGSALASEEFSARFFTNGSTHDIALKSDKNLQPKQIEDLRASYLAKYGGSSNNRSPLILTGGLSVEKLSITPADAALLPTRQFTVEEICRIFGVPPFMVGANDKATSWGTGLEQMGMSFVRYTLRRHLTHAAQEFNRKLWPNRERYYTVFDVAELTKADFKTRMEGYRIAVGRAGEPGWMTPNQVRHQENMEPVEGGDKLNVAAPAPAPGDGKEPPTEPPKDDDKEPKE